MLGSWKKERRKQYEEVFSILAKRHCFAIIRDLGIGGYGHVKEIKIKNHSCALKLQLFKTESEEYANLFKKKIIKELELSQSLRHKNLVHTFKVMTGQLDKRYIGWAFMEKCVYGSLDDVIQIINKTNLYESFLFSYNVNFPFMYYFSENLCKYLIKQLLWGLGYLHQSKLCHFDIKPENIFLTYNLTVKIGDFGLTEDVLQNKEGKDKFKELKKGSFYSMGPEYYENNRTINTKFADKVDIFGVGTILFLMIFKRTLIETPKGLGMTSKILRNQIMEGIKTINKNEYISKNLKTFMTKIINADYKMRPSVYELLEDDWVNTNQKIMKNIKEDNEYEEEKIILEMQKSDTTFFAITKKKFKCNNTKNKKFITKKKCFYIQK